MTLRTFLALQFGAMQEQWWWVHVDESSRSISVSQVPPARTPDPDPITEAIMSWYTALSLTDKFALSAADASEFSADFERLRHDIHAAKTAMQERQKRLQQQQQHEHTFSAEVHGPFPDRKSAEHAANVILQSKTQVRRGPEPAAV